MEMKKTTLFKATLQKQVDVTFLYRRKMYTLVAVANENVVHTYVDSETGKEQKISLVSPLYIVREVGKLDSYKVWPSSKYDSVEIILLD